MTVLSAHTERALRLSLCLLVLTLRGCRQTTPECDRRIALKESAFYGVWVIDHASLSKLRTLGYDGYLTTSCHMLKLNPDGTCVYRAFTDYPDYRRRITRRDRDYEEFFMEGATYGVPYESWYVWMASATNLDESLGGPFDSRPQNNDGVTCKNKWPRWRLIDWSQARGERRFNMGERYSIQCCVVPEDPIGMGVHWTVRVQGEVCLLQFVGHAGDTIALKKH